MSITRRRFLQSSAAVGAVLAAPPVRGAPAVQVKKARPVLLELDPDEDAVGYGGLPNADGVVQLDASCMHGPKRSAGAVACLEGVRTPSLVAKAVMETACAPHCELSVPLVVETGSARSWEEAH